MPTPEDLLGTIIRLAWLAGIVLVVGVVAFRELVMPRLNPASATNVVRVLAQRAAVVGVAGAIIVLVAAFGRLWIQLAEVRVPGSPVTVELVRLLLLRTTWGVLWLIQAGAALVAWRAFAMAARDFRVAWVLATLAAVILALLTSFTSHASGTGNLAPYTVAADTIHLLAAGAWVGGLATLFVVAVWPRRIRVEATAVAGGGGGGGAAALADNIGKSRGLVQRPEAEIPTLLPALVRAFSPVALIAAGLVVLSGAAGTLVHLDSPTDLWLTGWGRALLVKLAFVLLTMSLGALNWKRVTPTLGTADGDLRFRMTSWFELTGMLLVLLATSVLVAMPV